MKKIFALIFVLLLALPIYAADVKVTDMTADTAPTADDLLMTINDPGGTAANRKVTVANAMKVWNIGSFASPTTTNPYSLDAGNATNFIIWYNASSGEIDLPAAVAGMNGCVYLTSTNAVSIDPNGTDVIVKAGTALSAGTALTLAGVAGNFVCLVADAANHWVTMGYIGTLGP